MALVHLRAQRFCVGATDGTVGDMAESLFATLMDMLDSPFGGNTWSPSFYGCARDLTITLHSKEA